MSSNPFNDTYSGRDNHDNSYRNSKGLQKQRQEAEIKQKQKEIDDQLARTMALLGRTEDMGADTVNTLQTQNKQLENIDENLHEAEQELGKTKHTLKGMKSWSSAFTNWAFGKKPQRQEYVAPEDNREYQSSKTMLHQSKKKQIQNEAEVIVRSGFLEKKGSGMPYAFRRRWCVLKLNGEFLYYTDDSETDLKGSALFPCQATIHILPDSSTRFHVTDLKEREWIFDAADEEDRGKWCAAIKQPKRYLAGVEEQKIKQEHVDYDQQLDNVLNGVKRLNMLAQDQATELAYGDKVLDSIEDRMERVDAKTRQQNRDIKKIGGWR